MVSLYKVRSATDTFNACSVNVQHIKMLTICSCFATVASVLFSLRCSQRTQTVVIRHLLLLSFVRWHILFSNTFK